MRLQPVSNQHPARRPFGVSGPPREGVVEKLNNARCKWMVTLHRYSSKTHRGTLHQYPVRNTSGSRSKIPGRGLVPAADFCPECGSIVPVELERSNEGEFIAEHRRACSVCESGQRKTGTSGSRRIIIGNSRRRFLDQDWRLWKDQINLSQQERSQFNIRRSSGYVPIASLVAGEDQGAKLTNQHFARSFEDMSESRTHGSAEGGATGGSGFEDHGTAMREVMVEGVMPSASRANRNPASTNPTSTEKQRLADSSDPTCGDQASSNPVGGEQASNASGGLAGTSGGDSRNEGTLPADGEWAEQIREKDELISTLKRQLTALGEQPMEEVVTLEEAKKRLRESIDALMAGDASAEREQALDKWDKYVTNHPDHIKEQAAQERAWEAENEPKNNEALRLMKTFVPPNIFHADLDGLRGGGLPPALAKRIFDRKVLWLIRAPNGMVSKTHVVELKSKFVANDLDVVESRALHACLPSTFENDADGAKTAWRDGFRKRLKELLGKETTAQIKPAEVRRPVYKDLAEGPFDPYAAAEEQETMRSSAFDASEKPAVGGKLAASKIAVIGEGLAVKLKPEPLLLERGTDLVDGETARSAASSPASKYRRQSYARSRAQPTACSVKNMMSELGDRLSNRRLNQRRTSSFSGSHDLSKLLRGPLKPVLSFNDATGEQDETPRLDDLSSEDSTSEAAAELIADPAFSAQKSPEVPSPPPPPPLCQESSIAVNIDPRPSGNNPPPSMKNMMAELASKARAREERSAFPPSDTSKQSTVTVNSDARPGGQSSPPSMKNMMAELASKAKAREERSASPPSDTPKQPTATVNNSDARPGGQSSPPSMKNMMAELASKAKAREERSASPPSKTVTATHTSCPHPADPAYPEPIEGSTSPPPEPPPPPPSPSKHQQETAGAKDQAKTNTRKTSKPVSMKEMMAELEMKANARANRNVT